MFKRRTFLKSSLAGFFPFMGLPSTGASEYIERLTPYPDKFERIEDTNGILTGFRDLDFKLTSYKWSNNGLISTDGFRRSDFVLLAGRSAERKTVLAVNIVRNVVLDQKKPVSIFSLGGSKLGLEANILCSLSKVDSSKLKVGYLREDEKIRLQEAASALKNAPFFIDDTPCLSVQDIKERILMSKSEFQPDLIIIDPLQLVYGGDNCRQDKKDIYETARSFSVLAKEIEVPIIALLNLDEAYSEDSNYSQEPNVSDLRFFGKIEQEADVILFIHTDEDDHDISNVIVAQNRDGNTGTVSLVFNQSFMRFDSLAFID